MGLRIQRRIKLGGGLGINIGKKGFSLSTRTKVGSIGTKGYSIKTGIPGVFIRNYTQTSTKPKNKVATKKVVQKDVEPKPIQKKVVEKRNLSHVEKPSIVKQQSPKATPKLAPIAQRRFFFFLGLVISITLFWTNHYLIAIIPTLYTIFMFFMLFAHDEMPKKEIN